MRNARQAVLELAGREVVITNPDKPFFPQAGHTKLHLVRYYAAVAEGALRGIAGRPIVLKRYVDGAAGEPFFQKRAPEQHPTRDAGMGKSRLTTELGTRLVPEPHTRLRYFCSPRHQDSALYRSSPNSSAP